MPNVDATGAKLYFEESGDGYPIIFLHEFGQDLRQWEGQVRRFSRAYRCVAYNARGYLPSDVPEDPALYGCEFSVDDVAAVMRDLSIEQARQFKFVPPDFRKEQFTGHIQMLSGK